MNIDESIVASGKDAGKTSKERHCGLRFIFAFVSKQLPRDCAERYQRMKGLFAALAQGGRLLLGTYALYIYVYVRMRVSELYWCISEIALPSKSSGYI